ncbi:hypothetical protein [Gemmatimonas sp.]|uniref:hypothetical protein n=1 Tax=Gemmatimonas sp. TaxID=1962908 RepID=UPI003982FB13
MMPRVVVRTRAIISVLPVMLIVAAGCRGDVSNGPPSEGRLATGTWGADSAGVLVNDTIAHVHIGCTFGDIPGRVPLDSEGRFTAAGSFRLRASPVAVGPTMPAQFVGRVSGAKLTITVTVTDTIAKMTVVRGPVTVTYQVEPRLQNCPICRLPGVSAARR